MKDSTTPFALALREAGLRPLDYCRAVEKLTGQSYSPVMTSRWISGLHDAPAPAISLAILLGRLPDDEKKHSSPGRPEKSTLEK